MKKTIVGVFAHPDDEAFGPGGTVAKLAKENSVYLICVTNGEAGQTKDPLQKHRLGEIRRKELEESAKILGLRKVYFLDFKDGSLNNNLYHKLAQKIEAILKKLKPEIIISHEPRGISGHIDHIVVSMVTNYVFYHLPFVKKLMMHCITKKRRARFGDYFVYVPPGYDEADIDEIVDISEVWETKLQAMHAHKSQLDDVNRILKQLKGLPKKEYFLVLTK